MKTNAEIIADRDLAIRQARAILEHDYVVLDTETTGLTEPEMCQIAYLYKNGMSYKSLVKSSKPIEDGATNVHGITNLDINDAPMADEIVLPKNTIIVIYNAPFDIGVIVRSLKARGISYSFEKSLIHDAMQIYSSFRGEWDEYHGNYRWHRLGVACLQCGIVIDMELHDAMSDVIMTERLIKYIAKQKLSDE